MLQCCMRSESVEKGTETLLARKEFNSTDLRDLGEKDLTSDLTYDTLKIIADPTRVFSLERKITTLHLFEVWEGRDVRDGKRVMIKIMDKETKNPEKATRQEDAISAQAVYNLDCSGGATIASIFGIFEQFPVRVGLNFFSTRIWYVQDYCGPMSLCDYLIHKHPHPKEPKVSGGINSEAVIANLMRQILEGINEAHQAHVVLRNICSMNVFINTNGDRVKIHDFWYCVELSQDDSGRNDCFKSTVWAGYPSCLAPEALLGNYYQAGDIWSAGLLAYEMGMGTNPFTAVAVECLQAGISIQVAQKLSRRVAELAATLEVPPKQGRQWNQAYVQFVKDILQPDHARRPTAAKLLEHPFLRLK